MVIHAVSRSFRKIIMLGEITGLLVFVTLLATYACDTSGSKDDSLSANKRFLLDGNAVPSNISLEQFASCYLTCTTTYGKLLETCCKSGLSVVCSNLPWDILKPKLGSCPGLSKSPTTSDELSTITTTKPSTLPQPYWSSWGTWTCGHQGSVCFQTRERKCSTGVDKDCESQPGEMSTNVRLCSESTCPVTTRYSKATLLMTSSLPPTTPTTSQQPYWLPWGSWICEHQSGACFQKRKRNCSTGIDYDCEQSQGGKQYNVGLCTETSCPDPCQDDPTSIGCTIPEILTDVCKETAAAWKLCRRSCGLCDSCWDYLPCSSPGAQKVFCGREEYAVQYCRKTCGKCSHKPVDVQLNKCGDPVGSELICDQLQSEICICNDPDLRALCGRYCENKCAVYGHPYTGSNCKPAMRKKREAILNQVMFN